MHPQSTEVFRSLVAPSLQALRELYASMDQAYSLRASSAGFTCSGCQENCCEERFYHFTLVESLYLREGVFSLDPEARDALLSRAAEVAAVYHADDAGGRDRRVLCPLNRDGLCMLYAFRPMICRLHGIPNLLRKPGQKEQAGPGCGPFETAFADKKTPDLILDRTPFYATLASIEISVRKAVGFQERIRKTVAHMVLDCAVPSA